MALNNISELSTTAAGNVDFAGTSILGTGLLSTADDSFRNLGSFLAKQWSDLGGVNTVAGTANAITVTTSTVYTALKTGMFFVFTAGSSNTGATTLNLDGIGAKAVRKVRGGADVALNAGDIKAARRYSVIYSTAANSAAGGWILRDCANIDKGADVASATTLDLESATGTLIDITGTTTVTAVTLSEAGVRIARASGVFTLTAGASLIVNGSTAVNYTTTADDLLLFEGYASSVVRMWVIGSVAAKIAQQVFTSSATFTTPANSNAGTVYRYRMVGGGGGGGGANGGSSYAGGGGQGGYAEGTFTGVAANTGITITIGAAGTSGSSAGGNGGTGGSTTIGSPVNVTCAGGTGGTGSTGSVNVTGGPGGGVTGSPALAIGGSSGFHSSSAGTIGGKGGGGQFGEGGNPGAANVSATGGAGVGYGSGGGGSIGTTAGGGPGQGGLVIIEWVL